jgi:hypothetical protein
MEKLMRNLLGDVDVYIDGLVIPATWKDIKELSIFQEKTGIKVANKLTETHVNYKNNK